MNPAKSFDYRKLFDLSGRVALVVGGGSGIGQAGAEGMAAQGAHVVSVDHAHVGPVELLPPQAGRPERLDRLLQLRPESLEGGADATGQPHQPALEVGARAP